MRKVKKLNQKNLFSWKEHRKELLKDPEVRKAHLDLQPEFAIIERIIQARIEKGISQEQLAERMRTKQSAISRLESGTANPSLKSLKRLAGALNSRLEIHLIPN